MAKKELFIVVLALLAGTVSETIPARPQVHGPTTHWQTENHAQKLNIEFDGDGVRLASHKAAIAFRLAGYGYGDDLHKPDRATVFEDVNRLEYRRAELTEWYVNGEQGLEQGFTFPMRPGRRTGAPLTVSLDVTGNLRPRLENNTVLLGTSLRYAGLTALDASGRRLPSWMDVRGNQIRLMVDDTGARYPVVVDPTWTSQTLSHPSGATGAGGAVAMSGSIAVVGAPGQMGFGIGAVYIYTYSGSAWSYQATLTASDGASGDEFGQSVAISGTTVVVGALAHKVGSNTEQGAVYVFTQSGSTWTQQAELTSSDGARLDLFGTSVAISGATIVVGAEQHTASGHAAQGAVYVFTQNESSSWVQQAEVSSSDGAVDDILGFSMAFDGTTIIAGAPEHKVGSNSFQGAAYIFTQNEDLTWSQKDELTASDGQSNNSFGSSVAVSGTTVVVGADEASTDGRAYVFTYDGSSWSQQSELSESDPSNNHDNFGSGVAISGEYVVVGASSHSNASHFQPGRVYVFQSGAQIEELEPNPSNDNNSDGYGTSVGGESGLVIGGAPNASGGGFAIISSDLSDLSISATHAMPVFQSGPVNISLTVTNLGSPTAGVATVSDTIPSDLTINAAPGCSISGQDVSCTLAAGAIGTNTFNVYTTASASAGASDSNTATLSDSSDTVSNGSSSDTIGISSQALVADSKMSQTTISGSTNGGACASGNNTLTATVQLENTSGSTMTNPYAANISLSAGNTLISNTSNAATVAASGTITFTFDVQLATCNTFHLGFDVRSN